MNIIIKYIVIFVIFFFFVENINSQDYSIFNTYEEIVDTNENRLFLKFLSVSFLKNNEYFDTIVKEWELETLKGWTGIGFMLQPKMVYQPGKTTQVELGYFIEKFSGRNELYKPVPLFRIRQMLNNNLELVFGHLYGSLEHGLNEPMYRFDGYYFENVEYGIQFLYKNKYFKNDLWLNWEKYILYDDPFKEEFVLGNTGEFKYKFDEFWRIKIPFHYTWTHSGGQIDLRKEDREATMSLNNIMSGIEMSYSPGLKYLKRLKLSYSYYYYNAGSNPPEGERLHQIFDKGYGHYIKSNIDLGPVKLMLGYWKCHNFIARRGEYIFESIYEHLPNESISDKELINFKFIFNKKIKKGIVFSFRSDFYIRPYRNSYDYSYAFYFIYNDGFLLKKISNSD